jgi:hypothetical protein
MFEMPEADVIQVANAVFVSERIYSLKSEVAQK